MLTGCHAATLPVRNCFLALGPLIALGDGAARAQAVMVSCLHSAMRSLWTPSRCSYQVDNGRTGRGQREDKKRTTRGEEEDKSDKRKKRQRTKRGQQVWRLARSRGQAGVNKRTTGTRRDQEQDKRRTRKGQQHRRPQKEYNKWTGDGLAAAPSWKKDKKMTRIRQAVIGLSRAGHQQKENERTTGGQGLETGWQPRPSWCQQEDNRESRRGQKEDNRRTTPEHSPGWTECGQLFLSLVENLFLDCCVARDCRCLFVLRENLNSKLFGEKTKQS